jgi:hypothetical protein
MISPTPERPDASSAVLSLVMQSARVASSFKQGSTTLIMGKWGTKADNRNYRAK